MLTEDQKQKLREKGREDLIRIDEINESGYSGILSNGGIVDRRKYPMAIPVQKNTMMGIPEAKDYFEPCSKEEYNKVAAVCARTKRFVMGAMFSAMIGSNYVYILDTNTTAFYKVKHMVLQSLFANISLLNDLGFTIFRGFADKGLNTAQYGSLANPHLTMLCGALEFKFEELKQIVNIINTPL